MDDFDKRLCETKHKAVDEKICLKIEQIEAIINGEIEAIKIRLNGIDEAFIARKENNERRFQELNTLRMEVVKDRELFVSKAVYEERRIVIDKWKDEINSKVTTIETRLAVYASVIGFVFILIQIALHYLK